MRKSKSVLTRRGALSDAFATLEHVCALCLCVYVLAQSRAAPRSQLCAKKRCGDHIKWQMT